MKIILDAMGGDHAPKATVEGAVLAAEKYGCNIILVGKQEEIDPILAGRCADRITPFFFLIGRVIVSAAYFTSWGSHTLQ